MDVVFVHFVLFHGDARDERTWVRLEAKYAGGITKTCQYLSEPQA